MITNLHGATLPTGWTCEIYGRPDDDCVSIVRNELGEKHQGGIVTIDLKRRIFCGGLGFPHKHAGKDGYTGRGWKKKIIEDACAWLERAMT